MWEVHAKLDIAPDDWGITPTYVGSTFPLVVITTYNWDHPHVCGKYKADTALQQAKTGSPPRMWEVLL